MSVELMENTPALMLALKDKRILIVSDLHFGYLKTRDKRLIREMLEEHSSKLLSLLEMKKLRHLIICGDIKDPIGKPSLLVMDAINRLLEKSLDYVERVYIVKGNHDGLLQTIISRKIKRKISIRDSYKISYEKKKCLIVHGHKKISNDLLKDVSIVISGHLHPAYSIYPSSLIVKVWAYFTLQLRIGDKEERILKWLVIPAFNSAIWGLSLNLYSDGYISQISPFKTIVKILKRNFLLLDLTPLEETR